ncbi:nuclear transport factor 2 family protein [Flagellimonas sp. S174]|uniref:nuclear transport factor 2 family protein n=1 Tax=Flagellimonas sp. S174 TaxID=3410790 RepID=UPI003BF510DC
MVKKRFIVSVFMTFVFVGFAQVSRSSELYQTLKKKDSLLFNAAFNTCEIEVLNSLFAEDFEFYHDKVGITDGKDAFIQPIASGCDNWKDKAPQPAKRYLMEGSLEVYPLRKNGTLYGAIQHGVHSFEFLNENKEYQKGDIAKFTHIWILDEGNWKLKRELSYNHQSQ